jgi:tetratricopeptide (TPR) repeat protein
MANLPALMRYCLSICFLLSSLVLSAQEYRTELYLAYIHDQMDRWKELMDQMEKEYWRSSDPDLLYTMLEAEYGYTGWLVGEKKKTEAEELLKKAEGHMVRLTDLGLDNARVYSLKGAFYGFQILLEPARAPKLGRLSMEANDKAMELDQDEPQVWLEKANMEYYRPVVFGGSKRNAVPMYEKAVELFESSPELTRHNWIYLNCLASLGIAYENTRKYSEAGKVYRKILNLEPSFKWVKDELYRHFQEKHSGK